MYDSGKRSWIPECRDESVLDRCRKERKKGCAEDYFLLADNILAQAEKGAGNADAVWMMEEAAKADYAPAAFAMGQMFRHGWAVHRDLKSAALWFERALQLGYPDAGEALKELEREKRRRIKAFSLIAVLIVLLFLAAFGIIRERKQRGRDLERTGLKVLVGENTELTETVTLEEFNEELRRLIEEYDSELVVSGKLHTNRLILKFEGEELNLTDFLADRVIARENRKIIIQFSTEEEAQRCLKALQSMEGMAYVEEDVYYRTETDAAVEKDDSGASAPPVYDSAYSGYGYYSWGVADLELDQLAAWLGTLEIDRKAMVAVVDSGTVINREFEDRILDGVDLVAGGDGHADRSGHGTHVAGTVLDCTRGLNVTVLPVRVMDDDGNGSAERITAGIEYAILSGADVINLSLGGPVSAGMDEAVKEAVTEGIMVIVSAGNGDAVGNPMDTGNFSPAHLEECIVVSAYASGRSIAGFSNYGDSVDISAPGVDILSYTGMETMAIYSGTSMAAPHISALAAMLRICYPNASPAQMECYIKDYCIDMGNEQYFGAGVCKAGYFIEN